MIAQILGVIGPLITLLASDKGRGNRKNLRMFKKYRRKLYKEFKKDGFTTQEKVTLYKIDAAYIEILLKLGTF